MTSRLAAGVGAVLISALCAPAASATGGPNSPNGNGCQPVVGGQVGATNPVPVLENATLSCPFATGPTGVPAGPPGPAPGPSGPFQPGQSCWYVTLEPIKIVVTSGGGVSELDPNSSGTQYTAIGYPKDLAPIPVMTEEGANIYLPYRFSGTADAGGFCTVKVTWTLGCPNPFPFTNFVVAGNVCWHTVPKPAIGTGLTPGQLTPFLDQAKLLQFINLGTLSSLPANPNPGLVNIGTCYFLKGASFQALGGAPQPISQPAFYTMSVSSPLNDGTGRFIFYVFLIELGFSYAEWDFGDGDPTIDGSLPSPCLGVPADLAVSHTYRKYGTFQVSIKEHYDVTVEEMWEDARGAIPPMLVPGVVPPITRTLGPYTKQVLQEEGVPVGR